MWWGLQGNGVGECKGIACDNSLKARADKGKCEKIEQ